MRTRLWLWLFTLVFAGFVLHATVCACEVVHPRKGSTKPCIAHCHSTDKQSTITNRAARPDILHPALLSLVTPPHTFHTLLTAFIHFTPENADPLLARGPPLPLAPYSASGAR